MSTINISDVPPALSREADEASEAEWESLSLIGGPLHELGRRLGLVRGTNTIPLGIAIGAALWVMLLIVAAVSGSIDHMLSLSSIAAHLRLLIVIPLMFVCETWLDPRVGEFVRSMVKTGVIPPEEYPTLRKVIGRVRRLSKSWRSDVAPILFAIPLIVAGPDSLQFGTIKPDPGRSLALSIALAACVTFFRYLVLRWVFRIVFWLIFLWRMSRMKLHLIPIHPDRAGGLGELEIVQFQFLPLVAGISVLLSSAYAEQLTRKRVPVSIIYPAAAESIVIGLVVACVPLLLFTAQLVKCRERGYADYMAFASRYVHAFEAKWLHSTESDGELLGTGDIQSLADLSNSVGIARDMRLVPASLLLVVQVVAVALLPLLPLSLFKQSAAELIEKILMRLLGG